MGFGEAIKSVFKKYAVFQGRSRRSEYWYFFLMNVIVSTVLNILSSLTDSQGFLIFLAIVSVVYSLALIVPAIAVSVRRLHDIGKSGVYYLFFLIPLVGQIMLLVWFATDSMPGDNMYGPNPKGVGGTNPAGNPYGGAANPVGNPYGGAVNPTFNPYGGANPAQNPYGGNNASPTEPNRAMPSADPGFENARKIVDDWAANDPTQLQNMDGSLTDMALRAVHMVFPNAMTGHVDAFQISSLHSSGQLAQNIRMADEHSLLLVYKCLGNDAARAYDPGWFQTARDAIVTEFRSRRGM